VTDKKHTNASITARYKQSLFASTATYYEQPVAIESGKGTRVRDFDGREYLDFFGGILTISVGHANDKVNAAVRAQMERLGHVSTVHPTSSSSSPGRLPRSERRGSAPTRSTCSWSSRASLRRTTSSRPGASTRRSPRGSATRAASRWSSPVSATAAKTCGPS
jgi:hypothetical protein